MVPIPDQVCDFTFPIEGLRFEPNLVRSINGPPGWFTKKLTSSPGPLISDFVTHESGFSYSTYGIHVGQDDRLTFMGHNLTLIEGHFVDCRQGSTSHHERVAIRFAPSLARRLVIPRGVAHTFDNLEHIVTRDEPIWYSDYDNKDWNIDNDLVSVLRETEQRHFPTVRANKHRLPANAHLFLSRLSQTLLENPKSYLARFLLTIGSEQKYVMFEPTSWTADDQELLRLLDTPSIPGVEVKRSRYALTGAKSWTLVPSIGSCVADILLLPASPHGSPERFCHTRTTKWYTFLNNQGLEIEIDTVDCRRDSSSLGQESRLAIRCDPRVCIAIHHGIGYSFRLANETLVRCEHEVFVDDNEPRTDLLPFGQDLLLLSDEQRHSGLALPRLRCPDEVVYGMAQDEVASLTSPTSPTRVLS